MMKIQTSYGIETLEDQPMRGRAFHIMLCDEAGNHSPCLVQPNDDGTWAVTPHESWQGAAPKVIEVQP